MRLSWHLDIVDGGYRSGSTYGLNTDTVWKKVIFRKSSTLQQSPTSQPSCQPTFQPSGKPSTQPSSHPTCQPTRKPSAQPSCQPTLYPSSQPSLQPTFQPVCIPSVQPTTQPSVQPSRQPCGRPSAQPTSRPSGQPSDNPSMQPTSQPTTQPGSHPSCQPSAEPSQQPSSRPTVQPSRQPSSHPSCQPSRQPSGRPSCRPSTQPTRQPTSRPSLQPTIQPTTQPTLQPVLFPSSIPTSQPSNNPTLCPSIKPTNQPVSLPSGQPSGHPTYNPSEQPSGHPSAQPSSFPSNEPSARPSVSPTNLPTLQPISRPSIEPSSRPSLQPSRQPSTQPSDQPLACPSLRPTSCPSVRPSLCPSLFPSSSPTSCPSAFPSSRPSLHPSLCPTVAPTKQPINDPSSLPTSQPIARPSHQPSSGPTSQPNALPSGQPSACPSAGPSVMPSSRPSKSPSVQPTVKPSSQPGALPTHQPSSTPSVRPSIAPTMQPMTGPSARPSLQPSDMPSGIPSKQPSSSPTRRPSIQPVRHPSSTPTRQPSGHPSTSPSECPTASIIQFSTLPSSPSPPAKRSDRYLDSRNLFLTAQVLSQAKSKFKLVLPFLFTSPKVQDDLDNVIIFVNISSVSYAVLDINSARTNNFVALYDNIAHDFSGRSVSNAGDVNGDEFDDLIIGMPYASRCYVFLGTHLGFVNMTQGFTIFGSDISDLTGWSVSTAGDVNNDSFADIIIGAPSAACPLGFKTGAVYVIYGGKNVSEKDIHLNLNTSKRFDVLFGEKQDDGFGLSVGCAGDINSDSFADVIIGALRLNELHSGAIYLFYGGRHSFNRQIKLFGESNSWFGYSVSGAGDINHDGFDDFIVGSIPRRAKKNTEISYLIFGSQQWSLVSLTNMSITQGVVITGGGVVVSGVGDINGDGFDDVMVGSNVGLDSGAGIGVIMPERLVAPTTVSTACPSIKPSMCPTTHRPSYNPSLQPTRQPSNPTPLPSETPTGPTLRPSSLPTQPSSRPTAVPTAPSRSPTYKPSDGPSFIPSVMLTKTPTCVPTTSPTTVPSVFPSATPSMARTEVSSVVPTRLPSVYSRPTRQPASQMPSNKPNVTISTVVIDESVTNYTLFGRDSVRVLINTTSGCRIKGSSNGKVIYSIVPLNNTPVQNIVENFNVFNDLIDLSLFTNIHNLSDLQFMTGSVLIIMPPPSGQILKLLRLTPVNITAEHFIFHVPSTQNIDDLSRKRHNRVSELAGIVVGFVVVIMFICVSCSGVSLYLSLNGDTKLNTLLFAPHKYESKLSLNELQQQHLCVVVREYDSFGHEIIDSQSSSEGSTVDLNSLQEDTSSSHSSSSNNHLISELTIDFSIKSSSCSSVDSLPFQVGYEFGDDNESVNSLFSSEVASTTSQMSCAPSTDISDVTFGEFSYHDEEGENNLLFSF